MRVQEPAPTALSGRREAEKRERVGGATPRRPARPGSPRGRGGPRLRGPWPPRPARGGKPGSEMRGVPASEISVTTPPSSSRRSTRPICRSSLWSWSGSSAGRPPAPPTPRFRNSRPVRRVSSQATRSAVSSASRARGERSARLPIGVAAIRRRPARCGSAPWRSRVCRSSRRAAVQRQSARPQLILQADDVGSRVRSCRLAANHSRNVLEEREGPVSSRALTPGLPPRSGHRDSARPASARVGDARQPG